MSVFIVYYGNYYPRQVHSIWTNRAAAEDQAEAFGCDWSVEEWTVQESFRPGDPAR